MRIFPIIVAVLVSATLYVVVFERERLMRFAAGDGAAAASTAADVVDVADAPSPEAPAAEDGAARRVSVVAMRSQAKPIESVTMVRGQTEAIREVDLRAETSGQIVSAPLRRGAAVDEGEVLCRLDPGTREDSLVEAESRLSEANARLPEARSRVPEAEGRRAEARARVAEAEARVAEAKAQLVAAEIDQNAASRLGQDGFASQTRVATSDAALESARAGVIGAEAALEGAEAGVIAAEAGIESAEAQVEGARAGIRSAEASVAAARREIGRLEIRAPFAGLLETDTAELGSLLQPGELCATVIQLDRVKLVGFVPETALSEVGIGAPAAARLATGQTLAGTITFVGRSADPETRTFRVEVEIENEGLAISDGQTVEMIVSGPGGTAHLVPQSALTLDDEGRLGVRLAEDGAARFAPVELLRDTREGVYVGGLPDETAVIVTGQDYVSDGVALDVTYAGSDT